MYNNNSTMQMYSVNMGYGVQIGNEIVRVSAITGTKISNADLVDRFDADSSGDLARLQAYLDDRNAGAFRVYLLGYGSSVSLKIMTQDAYDLVKRPNIRLIKVWSVAEVLDLVIASGDSGQSLETASAREGIRAVVADRDISTLAQRMKDWLFDDNVSEAFKYGTGYVWNSMTPKVITTLAGYAGHYSNYNKTWSVHNYAAWEELRAHADDDHAAREVFNRISSIDPGI